MEPIYCAAGPVRRAAGQDPLFSPTIVARGIEQINCLDIIIFMKDFDHLALDGQALRLFLAVLEEGSVTAAGRRLGMTQSAISHGLQKLRGIVGDPLFVKAGRGIAATAHAHALAEKARALLDGMKDFARSARFDPATASFSLTIAANDLQRDLLLPALFARLSQTAARASLRVIPSGTPSADLLRENRCDLLISPRPPAGTDILQKRLFQDTYICFYDASMRSAPHTREDYLRAAHVTVVYPDNEPLAFDRRLEARHVERNVAVRVPGFSGVPAFLRGSAMLSSLPALLGRSVMAGFAQAPIPLTESKGETTLSMYMAWHRRNHLDPAHQFVRAIVLDVASGISGRSQRAPRPPRNAR
jgi:DNA-binding transcriptional LysR family regulator